MKKIFKIALSLLLLGSVFLCGGWCKTVKEGVTVNGVAVGGLSYAQAEEKLVAYFTQQRKPIVVHTPAGEAVFSSERFTLTHDGAVLLRRAKKGERLAVTPRFEWATMEEELFALCEKFSYPAKNASLSFSAQGFCYEKEKEGRACDYGELLKSVSLALERGTCEVSLRTFSVLPTLTEADLRLRTQKLSTFTTFFAASNEARSSNIRLACERLSGTEIGAGETLSFNALVGRRTRENGFLEAKVIQNGEFVDGVGGGVCQASSTLFVTALHAGMEIVESHPHSLSVSYVPPSLDAMVSSESDLRIKNPYPFSVYLLGKTVGNSVTFSLYGAKDGVTYQTESKVLNKIAPLPEKQVQGNIERVVRAEKEGITSESYLLAYRDGQLLFRKKIRLDVYAPVQGIREVVEISSSEKKSE